MALAELQAVLARLYTDKEYREEFFADVNSSCRELELSEDERRILASLDRTALEMYARALIGKRLEAVKPLIPAVAALLGERLRMWFERYCNRGPAPTDSHECASRFLFFLSEHGPSDPDYLTELLRAEAIRVGLMSVSLDTVDAPKYMLSARATPKLTARACVSEYDFDVAAIFASLLRGDVPPNVHDPSAVLFALEKDGCVCLRRLNPVAAQLIRAADGSQRWGDIVRQLVDQLGIGMENRAAFESECRAFMSALLNAGLVELAIGFQHDHIGHQLEGVAADGAEASQN